MTLSLIVALTCLFIAALLGKGLGATLSVLLLSLLPLVTIVVIVICNVIYNIYGIFGIITLVFFACVVLTPFTLAVGFYLDIEHGIDIFNWNPTKRKRLKTELSSPKSETLGKSKGTPSTTCEERSRRRRHRHPNDFLEQNNPYYEKKIRKIFNGKFF